MIRYRLRFYAYLALGLAIITWIALIPLPDGNLQITVTDFWNIPTAITINLFLWIVFIKWLWKWKLFYGWLVPFPDLNGKWEGVIKSNWESAQNPIPTEISIKQTFFHITVKLKTGESESISNAASFDIDKDKDISRFFYSYMNTPKPSVRDRSQMHYGTTLLNFEGYPVTEMTGEYWTSRESTGEIKLKRK